MDRSNDKRRIISILTAAFRGNSSVNFFAGEGRGRGQRIRFLMRYSLALCGRYGRVLLSADRNACALVMLPHTRAFSLWSVAWDLRLVLRLIAAGRLLPVLRRESRVSKLHPAGPFYYLWFIGVDPLKTRKGLGSALLKEVLEEAKQQGLPVYLETSAEQNLCWYEKFGFQVFAELDLGYRLYFLRKLD
jgi:ribosomal protein S18 acetylase RimI-like enzyme